MNKILFKNGACGDCSTTCKTCTGPTFSDCITCIPDNKLALSSGSCACHPTCNTCSGPLITNCITCFNSVDEVGGVCDYGYIGPCSWYCKTTTYAPDGMNGWAFIEDPVNQSYSNLYCSGPGITDCIESRYGYIDATANVPCDAGCRVCMVAGSCTECFDEDVDPSDCSGAACPANCYYCTGSTCHKCSPGYILNGSTCDPHDWTGVHASCYDLTNDGTQCFQCRNLAT